MAFTGAKHRPISTPASIALARGAGIDATARPSGRNSPATIINAAQTTKPPTAAWNPPAIAPELASSAAPGVDQAMLTGNRVVRLSTMAQSPIEIDSTVNPEAACPGVAPTACNPCSTTAKELANPTKAVRQPIKTAWAERSLSMAAVMTRKGVRAQWSITGRIGARALHRHFVTKMAV